MRNSVATSSKVAQMASIFQTPGPDPPHAAPSVISRGWGCVRRSCGRGCQCKADEGELIEQEQGDKETRRDVV